MANLPETVKNIFQAANPEASPANWAIRFAASLDGVQTVLSGMSSLEQVRDNLSFMKDFKPLSPQEQQVIEQARVALSQVDQIPCTACHYCTGGCPMQIRIPEFFATMNDYKRYQNLDRARDDYGWRVGGAKPSQCIQCGQCEGACPQHLPIMNYLKEIAEVLGK